MLTNKQKLLIILIPVCLILVFVALNTSNPLSKFIKNLTSSSTSSTPTTTHVPTTTTTPVPTTTTTPVPTTTTTPVPTTKSASIVVPVDCQVSDWIADNECSVTCGGGTQSFSRKILRNASNGGKACPTDLTKSVQCNIQPCPVDCQVSDWANNGSCSATCGGGQQQQVRTVLKEPSNGGKACPSLTQTKECNTQPCPVDCKLSEWSSPNGTCSATCGGGFQFQTRNIISEPTNGGKACPVTGSSELIRSVPCNTQPCPVDCQVSNWGPCTCLTKTQTRTVSKQPAYGGQECPALSQSCTPSSAECNDWYYFGNTYANSNELTTARTFEDSYKNCYSKCDGQNCIAVYTFPGDKVGFPGKVECSIVKPENTEKLIRRYGSMSSFNPELRNVYINKKLVDQYDPSLWNKSFTKNTVGDNFVNEQPLNNIAKMVTPGSIA